jgi:putative redox protein
MRFIATVPSGNEIPMDVGPKGGGENSAGSPFEMLIAALGGCTAIDVATILRKKRIDIQAFSVEVEYERAKEDPKFLTSVVLEYRLVSSNAEQPDLEHAITLSQEKFCSVSATVRRSGAALRRTATIQRPPAA